MRRPYHDNDVVSPSADQEGHAPKIVEPALPITPGVEDAKGHGRLVLADLTDQTNLLPFRKVLTVFLGLSVCIVVSTLDQTLVATALPSISTAFHAGSVSSFIPSTYLLTSTAFQPLYGRFSDIFGRKLTLCVAMGVFIVGNLAASFSNKISDVIVFRGFAGAGGGGIVSLVQIVMSDVVSLRDRGKYQGIIGVVVAFGNGIGPLIGGTLSEKTSWQWCFRVTLPLAICGILVVIYVLPLKTVSGNAKQKLLTIDYIGTALSLGGCTLVMLPLIWGGITFPWSSAIVIGTLVGGLLVVCLFCLWEWKGARLPIVPMYIFKHVTVSGVYITMFVNGFIFYSQLYYLPQFFQVALGYSPIRAAVFLLPVLVTQTLSSFLSGVAVSRTGRYRSIIYCGFAVWSLGCGLLSTVNERTKEALLVLYMLISGVGAGQTLQTTTVAAQASVSRRDMSVVTAVRNFVRLLGGTFSLAVGSTIINNSLRAKMMSLNVPSTLASDIINNPSIIFPLVHPNLNASSSLTATTNSGFQSSISRSTAEEILRGYDSGVRDFFILNASFAALSVVISATMIKHKELVRADDAERKKVAIQAVTNAKSEDLDQNPATLELRERV